MTSKILKNLSFYFQLIIIILFSSSSSYSQTITTNQTNTVTAESGDFVVNAGVSLTGTPSVNVSSANVGNFTNNGTISAGNNTALNFTSSSSSAVITNNGAMSGKDTIKINSPSAFTNSSTGTINASNVGISYYSGSVGSTFVLNNTLSSSAHGILLQSSGTINSITINSGATLTGNYAVTSKSGSVITLLTNSGTIAGSYFGIGMEGGAITTLKNLGTITSSSSRAQIYGGSSVSITNFTNSQKDLKYADRLPTNYITLISSSSSYGSIIYYSGTAGSTAFAIDATSSVTNNTRYSSMFSNLTKSNISDVTETGTFGGLSWALEENCSGGLDLVVGSVTSLVCPELSSSSPENNATGVGLDGNIVLNFNKAVDRESGNITIKKTSDNSTVETISVLDAKVTGTGTNQITINPSTSLDANTEYYVLIASSAFDDSDNNSYAGITSTTALSFTTGTGDSENPTLVSSVPANNSKNIEVNANIILTFSENVDVKIGNITIKKTSDNSTIETIDVISSGLVSGTGTTTITINPSVTLTKGISYYINIDASAFDDTAGNSYAGISSTTALSFLVGMVDPTTDKDVIGLINAQSQLAKNIISSSISSVSNRLSYLRHNRAEDKITKNNIKLDFGNTMLASLTNELLVKNDKSTTPKDWSLWSEGSISKSKIGDSANSSSIEIDGQALAIGFDKKLNNNDLLGFVIQYGKSDTDVESNGTNVDSKNYNISVYRTLPLKDDNFVEGLIGVGTVKNDLTRKSGANTLTGSRNGTQIFGSINYGRTIDKGDFNLTPIARVDLGYTELDAYSEIGTDALSYAKQTIESGLASVGLEFSDIIKLNQNSFKPFGSIEYGIDFSNSSNAKMNYASDTSTIYTYTQGANSNHLITSMVGFEYIAKDNLNIIASYKRIQGNESEKTDIVKFGANFKSKRETKYAINLSEDLKAGFDISKNINGFDVNLNANQLLAENSDQKAKEVKVSLSSVF